MSFLCLTDTYRGSREQAGWSGAVTGIERNRSPGHWSPAEQGLKSHHSAWKRKAPPYVFCFQGPRQSSTKVGHQILFCKELTCTTDSEGEGLQLDSICQVVYSCERLKLSYSIPLRFILPK